MAGYQDEIKRLEEEISKTKYNKRTQSHVGLVKAKLAKLREKDEARRSGGKKGDGYTVRRSGDATVVLLGFPSVGKSTLLNALTNKESAVGAYAFTTVSVIPGMLEYNHSKIQILDVPGILQGASDGSGRGKEVLSVIRGADMVLMVVDITHPEHLDTLKDEIYKTNVRVNQHKPDVRIRKTAKNGIRVGRTVRTEQLDDETISAVLKEFKINNAEVLIREPIDVDQLIDVVEANKVYMPCVVALNKGDLVSYEKAQDVKHETRADVIISAEKRTGTEDLKRVIFEKLEFIRVYLKEPRKEPDLEEPLIMRRGCTLRTVCERLHKDFVSKFKFVRIWGPSSKFPGQKLLSLDHKIMDEDVLEIHVR
ncbi:GTP-binding protein [Candidatus Woesearchaeota archaeon]|nr:GTP-binding protein [Candidatus Woesearchaeota archaeon]